MNTKSGVFTVGLTTLENTNYGVHSVKLKSQSYTENIKYSLYISAQKAIL